MTVDNKILLEHVKLKPENINHSFHPRSYYVNQSPLRIAVQNHLNEAISKEYSSFDGINERKWKQAIDGNGEVKTKYDQQNFHTE